jgi:hypothetical protein
MKKISKYYSGNITLNNKVYYFKVAEPPVPELSSAAAAGLELVVEKACKAINLHCAHYEIVKIFDTYYYLSEDINTYGTFKKLSEIDNEMNDKFVRIDDKTKLNEIAKDDPLVSNIYDRPFLIENMDSNVSMYNVWVLLEKKYGKEYIEELMRDLIKTYVLDILFYNSDRHASNFGVLESNGKPTLYVFDNSLSFDNSKNAALSAKYMKYEDDNTSSRDNLINNLRDLREFLSTSSEEYNQLCMQIINKLSPEYIGRIMFEVINENNLDEFRDDYFYIKYKNNYELLYSMIHKRGLK